VPSEQLYYRRIFQKAREYSLEYERLRHEKEQKEVLVFAVVHDLSGPLTSITGIVDIVSRDDCTEEERKRLLGLAATQTGAAQELIRSILEMFDEQDHHFDPVTLDEQSAPSLGAVLETAVENLYPAFKQRGVKLELNRALPDTNDKVIAESEQLGRMFTNLLENALRYSPVNSKVVVTLEADGDVFLVKVMDQGPGVPEELTSSLFQRFVGGRKYGGKAGFGLYYCQMCAKKWGGKIDYLVSPNAQSGASKGACFQVTLQRYRRN
jgi:signal transduction histidine kinase